MQDQGLIKVTKDQFYEVVGKLNVHPCPRGPYDQEQGYTDEWRMVNGQQLIGKSWGLDCLGNEVYAVTHDFYNANRDKFMSAS